ncbi:hypothetical protein ARMGADRAFT_1061174 [Armillaria gallica]|uniref:Uncharacterized protein n=1 Tax=Armillaria gallica TaxID=47427 RepID=A0A2H3DMQ8_ARMGA|nr:hypothetical protein ARMGADRAFT_1061174 [Armillaria gallica]
MVDRGVRELCIMGSTAVIAHRLITPLTEWKCLASLLTNIPAARLGPAAIPVHLRDSLTRTTYNHRQQYVGPQFALRVMFGQRLDWTSFQNDNWYPSNLCYHEYYIPMLEQVIPLGSVGYTDPLTRKFVFLFNAMDPASSMEPRIQRIPSILKKGVAEVLEDPGYSPPWDYAYNKFDILHKLDAWTRGRSVYTIPLALDMDRTLCLALGRASRRVLEDNQIKNWLAEHRQTITDVFGDDHPYIRKRLDVVTTTVNSSQYVWFAHLGNELYAEDSSSQEFYFQLDPQALVTNDC